MVYVPLTTVRSRTVTCRGCSQGRLSTFSGPCVRFQVLVSMATQFVVSSGLSLLFLFPPPIKIQSYGQSVSHLPGQVVSFSSFLSQSVCLFSLFCFLGLRKRLQVSVTVSLYLSAAETVCSLSLRVFDSL